MQADAAGYLQYHVKLAILGVSTDGFLCSGGTSPSSGTVLLEEAVAEELPRNFERCVWSLLPADTSGMRPMSPVSPSGRPDSSLRNPNTYVKYGDLVSLQHAKTRQHATVRTTIPSKSAPNCFTVDFAVGQQQNVSHCCFRILPKYKIRQEGEFIRLKDQVAHPHPHPHGEWMP